MRTRLSSLALAILALSVLTACQLTKQEAPPLMGPSGLSTSVTLTASPDRLQQDGQSTTRVEATVLRANGDRWSGLRLNWRVRAHDGSYVEPSSMDTVTDANGRASTVITAPAPPSRVPAVPVRLTVFASTVGSDNGTVERSIDIELVPPAGTPPPNEAPVADFAFTPAVPSIQQQVAFDASASTDEGAVCGTRCSYSWTFGDGSTGSGMFTAHTYQTAGVYTVTLTVTDAGGVSSQRSRGVTIGLPDAPIARITFSPAEPAPNQAVIFDAGGSTLGSGGTITSYVWTFGDSTSSETTTSAVISHAFSNAGSYTVRLTVTDSFGRTATTTTSVEVQ